MLRAAGLHAPDACRDMHVGQVGAALLPLSRPPRAGPGFYTLQTERKVWQAKQ